MLRRLGAAGWEGPYYRGAHPFIIKDGVRLTIPNPDRGDIDWSLIKRVLEQARISAEAWDQL